MYVSTVTVTIANGETVSTATSSLFLAGGIAGAIITPAALTGTALSFQVSYDGVTFTPLYATGGTTISYTVAASRVIPLDPAVFGAFPYIKLVSGSAEGAARTFTVIVRAGG
jgi:hypothetical protein